VFKQEQKTKTAQSWIDPFRIKLGKEKKERLIEALGGKFFKEDVKCLSIIVNEIKRIYLHHVSSSEKAKTSLPLDVCFIFTIFNMDLLDLGCLRECLSVTRQVAFVWGLCFEASWPERGLF